MLGAEAAAKLAHHVVNRPPYFRCACEESLALLGRQLTDVEMEVAIADVPVGDQAALGYLGGDPGGGSRHEVRQCRDRQRDVVLEARALVPLGLGDALTELPQCAALALAAYERRIEHQSAAQRRCQCLFQQRIEWFGGA